MQYFTCFIHTYATQTTKSEASKNGRSTRQRSDEEEGSYKKHLINAIYLCGNVHEVDEEITF